MSGPATAPIRPGLPGRIDRGRASLALRAARVRGTVPATVQIAVAATVAFVVAHYVLGHESPLLAGTVTISSLGLVRDARPIRVLETVVGMVLGIFVAETIVLLAGAGWWQLAMALILTILIARFLSSHASFAIAAAIQSFIVLALPASGVPYLRLLDGLVGAAAALLATVLIPRNPVRAVTADGHVLFARFEAASRAVVQGLRRGDRHRAERGLERARATQAAVDAWAESLDSGAAVARISPLLRRQRSELARQQRVLANMDYAVRNLRVIARRAAYLCDDGTARPVPADLLAELVRGADLIAQSLTDIAYEPAAQSALRAVATRLHPEAIAGASLGEANLIGALRPLAVDLLTASGVPPSEARAALPRG
ncbi:FUSC family protein [Microbacterium sp. No. 7]|uniref:FUSC family protein n=1 Tax=Microbacterium sp. No. 7 TaxID=1714373 RepID=UPI001E598641|nr:FUSC family protein [Microbacterium sp. No. 7]